MHAHGIDDHGTREGIQEAEVEVGRKIASRIRSANILCNGHREEGKYSSRWCGPSSRFLISSMLGTAITRECQRWGSARSGKVGTSGSRLKEFPWELSPVRQGWLSI